MPGEQSRGMYLQLSRFHFPQPFFKVIGPFGSDHQIMLNVFVGNTGHVAPVGILFGLKYGVTNWGLQLVPVGLMASVR